MIDKRSLTGAVNGLHGEAIYAYVLKFIAILGALKSYPDNPTFAVALVLLVSAGFRAMSKRASLQHLQVLRQLCFDRMTAQRGQLELHHRGVDQRADPSMQQLGSVWDDARVSAQDELSTFDNEQAEDDNGKQRRAPWGIAATAGTVAGDIATVVIAGFMAA